MKKHGLFVKRFCLALLLASFFVKPVQAAGWVSADYVQARLIASSTALEDNGDIAGALEIRLAEGWHAYWRMPGAGGLPPRFDWEGSVNLRSIDIKWPVPRRFKTLDLYSFGYEDRVLLPFVARAEKPQEDLALKLDAAIMVCSDICVPQNVALSLRVPAGVAEPTSNKLRIEKVIENLAYQENRPGLRIDNVVIGPDAIVASVFSQRGYDDADLFVESGDLYVTAPPQIEKDENDPRKAIMRVPAPADIDNLFNEIADAPVTLTLTDGRDAVEIVYDFNR